MAGRHRRSSRSRAISPTQSRPGHPRAASSATFLRYRTGFAPTKSGAGSRPMYLSWFKVLAMIRRSVSSRATTPSAGRRVRLRMSLKFCANSRTPSTCLIEPRRLTATPTDTTHWPLLGSLKTVDTAGSPVCRTCCTQRGLNTGDGSPAIGRGIDQHAERRIHQPDSLPAAMQRQHVRRHGGEAGRDQDRHSGRARPTRAEPQRYGRPPDPPRPTRHGPARCSADRSEPAAAATTTRSDVPRRARGEPSSPGRAGQGWSGGEVAGAARLIIVRNSPGGPSHVARRTLHVALDVARST